jgi:hypothetical protein
MLGAGATFCFFKCAPRRRHLGRLLQHGYRKNARANINGQPRRGYARALSAFVVRTALLMMSSATSVIYVSRLHLTPLLLLQFSFQSQNGRKQAKAKRQTRRSGERCVRQHRPAQPPRAGSRAGCTACYNEEAGNIFFQLEFVKTGRSRASRYTIPKIRGCGRGPGADSQMPVTTGADTRC